MKKENETPLANQPPSEPQPPAKGAEKKKKEKKVKEKPKETDIIFLPVLVEFSFAFSAVILAIVFFAVVGVSVLTGATLLDIVLRTSVTILVIGSLLILITRQISQDVLNDAILEKKEKEEEQRQPQQAQSEMMQTEQPPPLQAQPEQTQPEQNQYDEFAGTDNFEELGNHLSTEAQ
jgi:hypothetical protein